MLFDMFLGEGRLLGKIKSIRFITSDVAVVVAIGGSVEADQSVINPERNSIHTIITLMTRVLHCISKYKSAILGRLEKTEELTRALEQEKINKIILYSIN